MAVKQDQHEKLREVKAILQRLQRIGDDAAGEIIASEKTAAVEGKGRGELETLLARSREPAPPPQAEVNGNAAPVSPAAAPPPPQQEANGQAGPQKNASAMPLPSPSKPRAGSAPIIAALGTVVIMAGAGYWLFMTGTPSGTQFNGPAREIAGNPLTPAHPGDLDKARRLMDSGQIAAARQILEQPALGGTQDGAWLIARSFDPNYLKTIAAADAGADKAKATEWYRRWHEIAGRNGVVMDDARLKRIIDSMR